MLKTPVFFACCLLGLTAIAHSAEPSLELTLPKRWFAVPGVPMSLYYDNIVLTQKPESFLFEVTCEIGKSEARYWTVTPTDGDVGEHPMHIRVKDKAGRLLHEAQTVLQVAPRTSGADRELWLLIIGDSLTAATAYPTEIARLLSESGNPKWKMFGTGQRKTAGPGVAHEGYGGWKWVDFLSKFDPAPPGIAAGPVARKSTSPFIFCDTQGDGKGKGEGKGQLDIPRYFREHCDNQPPDVITFLLGINDCFGANPDAPDAKINEVLDHADTLLAEFRKAAPKATFAIGLTPAPNAREEAFFANYKDRYTRWGWKRIQHRLVQIMIERYGAREGDGIYLVPTELNIDPIAGYPDNNGVHPNTSGYAQIGTSFYAWMKSWME